MEEMLQRLPIPIRKESIKLLMDKLPCLDSTRREDNEMVSIIFATNSLGGREVLSTTSDITSMKSTLSRLSKPNIEIGLS